MNPLVPIFITGAVGLLGLIITKESKVSEFRQAWIDALRSEVAALLAAVQMSLTLITDSEGKGIRDRDALTPEARTALAKSLHDANVALFTIRLRLNPTETDSKQILQTLDEIEKLSNDNDALSNALSSGRAMKLEGDLVTQSKIVLSSEWARVKKGEAYFKWTRRMAAIFAILTTLLIVIPGIYPDPNSSVSIGDDASVASSSSIPHDPKR